jgi:hypothetical protein
MEKKSEKVQGAFTLRLPKDREQKAFFEVQLRELDEPTYMAAAKLIGAGKEVETVKFILQNLWVGGDPWQDVLKNFIAVRSASEPVIEILNPATGELKKN